MKKLGRAVVEWLANALYTFGAASVTWLVLGLAIWAAWRYPVPKDPTLDWRIPILPVSYYTAIWFTALLLPLTSTLYLLFDLRLRRNQIQDAAERAQIQFVYYSQDQELQFSRLLRQRFRETCQPWELVIFSLIAGAIAFVGIWQAFYGAFSFDPKSGNVAAISSESGMVVFAGFAGSLAGAYVYVFNKFRTFDIYPSTYLQSSIGFVAGTLGGVFVGRFYPAQQMEFLAFAVGFLTAVNVSFLSSLLRRQVATLTGSKLPEEVAGDLEAIIQNAGAIESLHNISIYTVADLVKADPLTLYLSLPTPIGVINGWLDEGLIWYYFGSQKSGALATLGIKRFTQLLELAVAEWPQRHDMDAIKWKNAIPLIAPLGIEEVVREQVRCIVEARIHTRLLAILSDRFRSSAFPMRLPPMQVAPEEQEAA